MISALAPSPRPASIYAAYEDPVIAAPVVGRPVPNLDVPAPSLERAPMARVVDLLHVLRERVAEAVGDRTLTPSREELRNARDAHAAVLHRLERVNSSGDAAELPALAFFMNRLRNAAIALRGTRAEHLLPLREVEGLELRAWPVTIEAAERIQGELRNRTPNASEALELSRPAAERAAIATASMLLMPIRYLSITNPRVRDAFPRAEAALRALDAPGLLDDATRAQVRALALEVELLRKLSPLARARQSELDPTAPLAGSLRPELREEAKHFLGAALDALPRATLSAERREGGRVRLPASPALLRALHGEESKLRAWLKDELEVFTPRGTTVRIISDGHGPSLEVRSPNQDRAVPQRSASR